MGVIAARRSYATFCCTDCGYDFAANIPAIFEDLPSCPVCECATQIYRILVESYTMDGRWQG